MTFLRVLPFCAVLKGRNLHDINGLGLRVNGKGSDWKQSVKIPLPRNFVGKWSRQMNWILARYVRSGRNFVLICF